MSVLLHSRVLLVFRTALPNVSYAADARIVLCANKADCEKSVRLRDERALAAEFSVPLIETSQLNPRAGRYGDINHSLPPLLRK